MTCNLFISRLLQNIHY